MALYCPRHIHQAAETNKLTDPHSLKMVYFLRIDCVEAYAGCGPKACDYACISSRLYITSVASLLVLGGGARPPNVPTERKICNLYARASEASERLRNVYFRVFKCTSAHTINAVPLYYLWHGAVQTVEWQILTLRKSMSMRAIVASELGKCSHFHILKLIFPSIFCWYFRCYVLETHSFNVQTRNICTYIARASERLRNIYFQDSNISPYIYNQCSFL